MLGVGLRQERAKRRDTEKRSGKERSASASESR